ncbi:DUF2157 domain-containing protein [Vandammella animalimorsus]|uniref:DUF2157 domain-containing protein n=1 Tax=Vandammella animalimorsus TaxID=2029117 RepID=UPI001EEDE165|nr:DUF2157 domain-containing protein [Vandammella animalimorsus]
MTTTASLFSLAPLDPHAAARPPSARSWRAFLTRLCLLSGALLLGAGLVFFFAFNWQALGRFGQLGLAASALLLAGGGTLATRPGSLAWRTGCLLVCIAIGALLALIGQKYQTGADMWQLFASWAALMLPVVLLARSGACWLLWLAVLDLALLRWLEIEPTAGPLRLLLNHWSSQHAHIYALALLNGLALLAMGLRPRWFTAQRRRWFDLALAAAALAPLTAIGLIAPVQLQHALLFLLGAGLAWYWYALQRPDAAALAMVYIAMLVVACYWSFAVHFMPGDMLMLLLALPLLAASSLAARHVLRVWRAAQPARRAQPPQPLHAASPAAPPDAAASQAQAAPWWLKAALSFSAWLCGLLLAAGGLSLLSDELVELPAALLALLPFALGLWLMRARAHESLFRQQLGFALSVLAQLWLSLALLLSNSALRPWADTQDWLPIAILALLASLPPSLPQHRVLCLASALGACLAGTLLHKLPPSIFTTVLFCATLAGWIFAAGPHGLAAPARPSSPPGTPAAVAGWARAGLQAMTLMALGTATLGTSALGYFSSSPHGLAAAMPWLTALAWLLTLAWLAAAQPGQGQPLLQRAQWWWLVALGLVALAWTIPNLLLCLALAAVLFQRRQPVWLLLALLCAAVALGLAYYEMQVSLLHKSLTLMGAGLALLLTMAAYHRQRLLPGRAPAIAPAPGRHQP